jgi:FKBP-type peptidyl-prolyl cis-trans isomerase
MKPRDIVIGIVIIIIALVGVVFWARPAQAPTRQEQAPAGDTSSPSASPENTMTTTDGLTIAVLQEGSGAAAQAGDTVTVDYTGWLTDGTKFDSSIDLGEPFSFHLGAHEVIAGWDEGVLGMKVGEKRKLTIPPVLGYGAAGAGGVIPPDATLVFEVELLGIK